MANYGWSLYEQAEYVDSYEWFSNSIREDLDYQDGYNGLGWTFGKLVELDSAVQIFMIGLTKPRTRGWLILWPMISWPGLLLLIVP